MVVVFAMKNNNKSIINHQNPPGGVFPLRWVLIMRLKPVECAVVSQQRNEGVRNTKPPAMRVV